MTGITPTSSPVNPGLRPPYTTMASLPADAAPAHALTAFAMPITASPILLTEPTTSSLHATCLDLSLQSSTAFEMSSDAPPRSETTPLSTVAHSLPVPPQSLTALEISAEASPRADTISDTSALHLGASGLLQS